MPISFLTQHNLDHRYPKGRGKPTKTRNHLQSPLTGKSIPLTNLLSFNPKTIVASYKNAGEMSLFKENQTDFELATFLGQREASKAVWMVLIAN